MFEFVVIPKKILTGSEMQTSQMKYHSGILYTEYITDLHYAQTERVDLNPFRIHISHSQNRLRQTITILTTQSSSFQY